MVLAGAAFASPSLLVPGFALLLLVGVSLVWVALAARGATAKRDSAPARIVEGDVFPLGIELRSGLLPPPAGELHDKLLGNPVRVGPFGPRRIELELRMPRRGRHLLDGTRWTIRDPLGLRSEEVAIPSGGELLVLPRIEEVIVPALGVAGYGAGNSSSGEEGSSSLREARAVEFEVDGLRPYREGSPASRIHWPALARSGEMHERRIVAGSEAVPLVALDTREPTDEEALDRAVRAAASICVHLAQKGGCQILLPNHRVPLSVDERLRAWPQVHARLAVVAAGGRTRAASHQRGSVFWVTAGPAARAARGLRTLGPGPHYLVSAERPAGGAAFTVAGCWGTKVGAHAAARLAA